jgi:anti-anti-sigma factor
MSDSRFEIEETHRDGWTRLTLGGELDLAAADTIRRRLEELRAANRHVRLDLSQLQFIDSSGAHVLLDAVDGSRKLRWRVEVEPEVSPQVRRFFALLESAGWNISS